MLNYKPGSPIGLSFQLEDDAGAAILPVSYDWKVVDEAGVVVQATQTVAVPDPQTLGGVLTLTVPGSLTVLPVGVTRAIRSIEVTLTVAGGQTYTMVASAMIKALESLVVGVNSIQTYNQALVLAEGLSAKSLVGWEANCDQGQRERALIEAYLRLCKLNLRYDPRDNQSTVIAWENYPIRLSDYTASQLAGLDPRMLQGFRTAQVVEASEILREDEIALARESGMISSTVGESSQFFRSSKVIDRTLMPISTAALMHIQRWVRFGVSLARR